MAIDPMTDGESQGQSEPPTQELDARGFSCPLPVLKAQKRLKSMAPGETLLITADDPRAPNDFRQFSQTTGHTILELNESETQLRILLRRK